MILLFTRELKLLLSVTLNETFDSLLTSSTMMMSSLMTCQYAIRVNTRPARFYLLPKVHKKGVPGRPVISACGSATEGLSEIVDYFLQPYLPTILSFIKDTDDFIRRIRDINVIPPGALLVTIGVVAQYTLVFLILMVFRLLVIFSMNVTYRPKWLVASLV